MSDYICKKNIKKPEPTIDKIKKATWDGHTIVSTVAAKPDGLLRTSVAATAIGIFFGIRAVGIGQQSALTHIHVFRITNVIAGSLPE